MEAEIYLAIRDGVGEHTYVNLKGQRTLVKDLPASNYNIILNGKIISTNQTPNSIPFRLMELAERKELPVRGIASHLSKLNIILEEI